MRTRNAHIAGGIVHELMVQPRGGDGTYRSDDGGGFTYVKRFRSAVERLDFWHHRVIPATRPEAGPSFRFVMLDLAGGEYRFVGEIRYADEPVLSGKPDGAYPHVVFCD